MAENRGSYPIGVVERDTGIGRDTLRVWERRYGFTDPVRNEKGERSYPEIQLRRLLDHGVRPAKLQVFQEHFLSEQLIRFLNAEIAGLQKGAGKPLVLLATLPGEEHTLGLMIHLVAPGPEGIKWLTRHHYLLLINHEPA